MAKKSIGELHATVTADATQFVGEFKRADNESRRSAAAINGEVDKLTKGLKKKFELADFGKDILKGAGLFGGMQIAQEAAAQIVGYWERAAASAKEIEASSEAALAATLKGIGLRQTDAQKLATLEKDMARKGAELEAARGAGRFSTTSMGADFKVTTRTGTRPLSDAETAAVFALEKEYKQLGLAIDEIKKKAEDAAAQEQQASALASVAEAGDMTTRKLAGMAAAQEAANKRFEEAEALTKSLRSPLEKYNDEIERLNRLEAAGLITTETAARAMGEAGAAYAKASDEVEDYASRLAASAGVQEKVANKASAWSSGMAAMWENVADRAGQSFADILISGENTFGNLVDIVARSVVEMAARLAIINPIINGLFGLSGAAVLPAFYGAGASIPGRAMGGGVEAGVTYRVNEQGQEFFKSNTGGTIIPAGLSADMAERGGRGDSYSFNYSFATGVTKAELGPLLALSQRQTLAQLADIRRRGGATARAY